VYVAARVKLCGVGALFGVEFTCRCIGFMLSLLHYGKCCCPVGVMWNVGWPYNHAEVVTFFIYRLLVT
jgi:hypothetical protein